MIGTADFALRKGVTRGGMQGLGDRVRSAGRQGSPRTDVANYSSRPSPFCPQQGVRLTAVQDGAKPRREGRERRGDGPERRKRGCKGSIANAAPPSCAPTSTQNGFLISHNSTIAQTAEPAPPLECLIFMAGCKYSPTMRSTLQFPESSAPGSWPGLADAMQVE